MSQYLENCASLEDLNLFAMSQGNPYKPADKENTEMDLNDELQTMQDMVCFNIFKRKCKTKKRYKEQRKDEIREGDAEQMKFLEKQIMRMRKKEENVVQRKAVIKRGIAVTQNQSKNADN